MCEPPKRSENSELCGILALAGDQKNKTVNATGGDALKFPLQHCFPPPPGAKQLHRLMGAGGKISSFEL